MSRIFRRQMKHENSQWPETLCEIPSQKWPDISAMKKPPFQVWRSRDFLVQIYAEDNNIVRMSICRTSLDMNEERWQDGITWDDLQRLKRECGYHDRDAVEIYPRDYDIVNVANMRHLWILPEKLTFGWRKK